MNKRTILLQNLRFVKSYLSECLLFQDGIGVDVGIRVFLFSGVGWWSIPRFRFKVIGISSCKCYFIFRVFVKFLQSHLVIELLCVDALIITNRVNTTAFPNSLSNANIRYVL